MSFIKKTSTNKLFLSLPSGINSKLLQCLKMKRLLLLLLVSICLTKAEDEKMPIDKTPMDKAPIDKSPPKDKSPMDKPPSDD